ncbi:MAG: putative Ig domain-containing protein, partial [Alphaproteobacteria bacterium]|nr:putative Ig domain-containing protein [Alphaproteobacteria bacterium]
LNKYKNDPAYYNRTWAKQAQKLGLSIFEDLRNPSASDLENLRRQRMTNMILSQVYVSWARYMSAIEDYQVSHELANVSEDIAEDTSIKDGSRSEKGQLEAARAIEDETKAMLAYVELQDALGNLYSALGMDAIPYYMLGEKPSKMAIYLRGVFEKWRKGDFLPDNRPYLLNVPTKRPPVNLSSAKLMPDVLLESGQRMEVTIPQEILNKMDFEGKVTGKAGLSDDSPLPDWLFFDENTYTFTGTAMPGAKGAYNIKVYLTDEEGATGYLTFKIKITDVYVPSLRVTGLTPGRKATVLKRCVGPQCTDEYIDESVIGEDVVTLPQ